MPVRKIHVGPALHGPFRRAGSALYMATRQPVGPSGGESREMYGHLQQLQVLTEVDLYSYVNLGLVAVQREGPSHAGAPQPSLRADPRPQGPGLLHYPSFGLKYRLYGVNETVCVEGPGVGEVP